MRARRWSLLLGLLAACAPARPYEALTTTAVVVHRPRAAPPRRATVEPKRAARPTQVERPPRETSPAGATATVAGAVAALPVLPVVPPTPITVTLERLLPPVDTGSELPGTLRVLTTLHAPGGIAPPSAAVGGATTAPRGLLLRWWLFPFFPFGLSRAGGP